jgi:hypothetical protein
MWPFVCIYLVERTWSALPVTGRTPAARSRHTAAAVDGKIYVFGGGDDNRVYNDLYILDIHAQKVRSMCVLFFCVGKWCDVGGVAGGVVGGVVVWWCRVPVCV